METEKSSSDSLLVHSFGVGHGDCTLVEYLLNGCVVWRLLYDAGVTLPEALVSHLKRTQRDSGKPDIDVAVLSHVDGDHQGGFHDLFKDGAFSVGEFWSPCLPAFRRLSWLFDSRVAAAVNRAAELEVACSDRGTPVIYPMEHHSHSYAGGRVAVSVISPPARLVRRLLVGNRDDIGAMLESTPLPLEWLFSGAAFEGEQEQNGSMDAIFAGRSFLTPGDIEEGKLYTPSLHSNALRKVVQERSGAEPDFFGNSVLNDTSLVVVVDAWIDGRVRRRLLLAGDQENWAYIASKHPAGLGVDILKAPHHGGQVYLADRGQSKDYAVEQMYLWLRPRTAFVSASGRYGLPHNRFRDALRACGATLICPNTRTFEPLTSGARGESGSCFVSYGCSDAQRLHTVITVKAESEFSDAPSCLQGMLHRGAAPIVVLQQRLVEPDEGFVRWTRAELEKNAKWVRQQLDERHEAFKQALKVNEQPLVASMRQKPVEWKSIESQARVEGRHQLLSGQVSVARFGQAKRWFWVKGMSSDLMYRLPTKAELTQVTRWLCSLPSILLSVEKMDWDEVAVLEASELVAKADWNSLCTIVAGMLRVPLELVQEEVKPTLVSELAQNYSIRWCRADIPHLSEAGQGKVSILVNLYRSRRARTDISPTPWQAAFWNTYPLNDKALQLFLDEAKTALFMPSLLLCRSGVWRANGSALRMLNLPSSRSYSGEPNLEEFATHFAAARWTVHWSSRAQHRRVGA